MIRWHGQRPIGGTVVGRLDADYHAQTERLTDAVNPDALECEGAMDAYFGYDVERVLQLKFSGSYSENWGRETSVGWSLKPTEHGTSSYPMETCIDGSETVNPLKVNWSRRSGQDV